MKQYKHLLSFDLTSYGTAFGIVNQYVDDQNVKVFEISPSGQSAVLVLLAQDSFSLQIIKSEAGTFFKDNILAIQLIENFHDELLPTYLSQNKTKLKKAMAIFEGSFVSSGMKLADRALSRNISLVDFRVVRTFPKNVIITFTSDSLPELMGLEDESFKKTIIEATQPIVKSYYEI